MADLLGSVCFILRSGLLFLVRVPKLTVRIVVYVLMYFALNRFLLSWFPFYWLAKVFLHILYTRKCCVLVTQVSLKSN